MQFLDPNNTRLVFSFWGSGQMFDDIASSLQRTKGDSNTNKDGAQLRSVFENCMQGFSTRGKFESNCNKYCTRKNILVARNFFLIGKFVAHIQLGCNLVTIKFRSPQNHITNSLFF